MFSFAFQLSLRHFLFLKTQTPTQTEKYVLFGGSLDFDSLTPIFSISKKSPIEYQSVRVLI
jgi:hypothetical protein